MIIKIVLKILKRIVKESLFLVVAYFHLLHFDYKCMARQIYKN